MADAVASQTLHDGPRNCVMKFTNISDGTGEAAVLKVDVSGLGSAPDQVKIMKIHYTTSGMSVRILWDATADVVAWILPADDTGCLDFTSFGGLSNDGGAGVTGDVMFTTVGHTAADTYAVVLEMVKF